MLRLMDERRTRVTSAARALPRPDELLGLAPALRHAAGRLGRALISNTREHGARLGRIAPRLTLAPLKTLIAQERKSLELSSQRAAHGLKRKLAFERQRFDSTAKLLDTLSYKSVLRRGFALVKTEKGVHVHAASEIKPWQACRWSLPMVK